MPTQARFLIGRFPRAVRAQLAQEIPSQCFGSTVELEIGFKIMKTPTTFVAL
jgi:hypothetical protein